MYLVKPVVANGGSVSEISSENILAENENRGGDSVSAAELSCPEVRSIAKPSFSSTEEGFENQSCSINLILPTHETQLILDVKTSRNPISSLPNKFAALEYLCGLSMEDQEAANAQPDEHDGQEHSNAESE